MPRSQPNALKIETFDNSKGGATFFKAIGHPLALPKIHEILAKLQSAKSVAIFDPNNFINSFAEIYDCSKLPITHNFVQKFEEIGKTILGQNAKPITELTNSSVDILWIAAFDADRLLSTIRHLIPAETEVISFDSFRIPDEMLSVPRNYCSPLNFATNFAFFRDQAGLHTRIVTANYWSSYNGGKPIKIWFDLWNEQGKSIQTWSEDYASPNQTIVIDSRLIRERFNLPDFVGQLFMHVIGAAGHEIVKYALDIYNGAEILSCTHDANSWPADFYAGLPAPESDEKVILWVQNSHPCPIPANGIGLTLMGSDQVVWYPHSIPPFATIALDTRTLLPEAKWPQQLEIFAGKYFVRPRYEITRGERKQRIAHANVERTDLKNDPALQNLGPLFGKGFILPAPILPRDRWKTIVQPNPMSTGQTELPVALVIYDKNGEEQLRHPLGKLQRNQSIAIEIEELLNSQSVESGHVELIYDFSQGGYADGWLHGLFRYHHKDSGQAAETSFGAHIFNTVMTYKQEPQSYTGHPPGLTTRLFLCLGMQNTKTLCHLIYPASTAWHPFSSTQLILHNAMGQVITEIELKIPCSGSHFWIVEDTFKPEDLKAAGQNGYVIIRDATCRLFGYHGLINDQNAFGFDHMFGF